MAKKVFFIGLLALGVLVSGFNAPVKFHSDSIVGIWWNQEKTSRIQVYKSNEKYYGKIVWLENEMEDGSTTEPNRDDKNPDPALRSRLVKGLVILTGLEWDDDEWDSGEIYDPKSGSSYSCYTTFEDDNDLNTLKLRGYMGFSLIGRTSYWTRFN